MRKDILGVVVTFGLVASTTVVSAGAHQYELTATNKATEQSIEYAQQELIALQEMQLLLLNAELAVPKQLIQEVVVVPIQSKVVSTKQVVSTPTPSSVPTPEKLPVVMAAASLDPKVATAAQTKQEAQLLVQIANAKAEAQKQAAAAQAAAEAAVAARQSRAS
jgi:hypothetical protein